MKVDLSKYYGEPQQVSVVLMIWNRNWNDRLDYFLYSLENQRIKPFEVIIIDNSNEKETIKSVERTVSKYPHFVKLYQIQTNRPKKAWALNYGIKRADEGSEYILTTDVDMVFPPNYMDAVMNFIAPNAFILTEPSRLPEKTNLDWIKQGKWNELYKMSVSWGKAGGPGNGQIIPRWWLNKVQGYDERFDQGQDAYDMDMWRRAVKDKMKVRWMGRRWNRSLHIWHPISPFKGKNHPKVSKDPDIVANSRNWGE